MVKVTGASCTAELHSTLSSRSLSRGPLRFFRRCQLTKRPPHTMHHASRVASRGKGWMDSGSVHLNNHRSRGQRGDCEPGRGAGGCQPSLVSCRGGLALCASANRVPCPRRLGLGWGTAVEYGPQASPPGLVLFIPQIPTERWRL